MFFGKKKDIKKENSYFVKIASLLIHAAKIDEEYSSEEENIIKRALIKLGANKNEIDDLIASAKSYEENANQILEFTREIKTMDEKNKIEIIKSLWQIIYSDKNADIYEANLMRRLSGLLYIDSKTMGDIKEQIKKEKLV